MDPSLRQKGGRLHIDTKLKAPSLTLPESQSSHEHSRGKDSRRVPHTKVYFHVACSTAFGEYVRVVGDHASLGNWQTKQGVRLETNDDIYPVYISPNPIFVELHARVQYRYVLCGPDDEPREWQASEATRSFIATGTEMTMEDDDGVFRQKAGFNEEDSDDEFDEPYHTKSQLVKNMDTDQKRSFLKEVLEGQIEIGARDTIFMLAFQLPVKVFKDSDGAWRLSEKAPNDGRNFAFLPLLQEVKEKKKLKVVNVGWPGVHPENDRERREIERLLAPHDFVPVFPPRSEFEGFLNFCRTFLWPVLHDSMQFFQSAKSEPFNEQGWAAYQHINNIYALAVVPHTHENDLIFIQDYHMLMTPTFIARKIHKANIGFYLHAPFPSSDSFKTLPVREEILAGMLSADQLGFQFFSYARNFLVSCKRVYGLDPTFRTGGFTGLEYNGRTVMIKVAHFAYPYQASIKAGDSKKVIHECFSGVFTSRCKLLFIGCRDSTAKVVNSEEVQKGTLKIKRLFEGKTIFACMDRADGLSALIPKFQAFRQFLKEKPEYQGKIILVQYCFDSLGVKDAGTAAQLRAEADALLKVAADGQIEIATKEGVSPDSCSIFLRFEKIERTDRLALFRAADVLLDTSAKNGLNLMPFEFVAAHHDMNDNKACIVSEFSGCSRVLLGSLRANPWNNSALCSIMERALTMPEEEKKDRFESNLQYVSQNSPMVWFEDFLTDLKRARKKDDVRIESIGFGAKIRQVAIGTNFEKLSSEGVLHAFRQAQKRVFFFDNEGTLAADKRHMYRHYGAHMGDLTDLQSRGSAPNQQVMDCLQSLCSDIRNTVVILSGRNREMMEQWFGKVPRLGLAAERGFFYKLPFNTGGQWHCMVQKPDYTWKSFAFEIMRNFVKRTQGSFIENKGSALVWQYRDADPHFGSWQAKELSSHLKELLIGYDLEILEGKGYVEVKVSGVNKGVAVAKALTKVSQTFGEVDFILCIGDDRSDEDMFEVVNQMLDPTDELETPSQISQDESSENESVSRLKAKSEVLLPKRQSSGKLGGLGGGGGLCGYSGDLRGSLSGGLDSLGGESSTPQSTRRFFTCTVGRKPSAAKFFLDDTEEVSELLASLRQVQEKQAKVPYPAAKYDSFTR